MATISLGQTLTGSFTSSTPKLSNGAYYYEYDLPTNLTSLSEITIAFDPVNTANSTNTPNTTTLDLINATTGAILAQSTNALGIASTFAGYIGLIDKTVAPGVNYKIRASNPNLSNGDFSLSLTNQGQATSIVSRGFLGFNGTTDTQVGTLTAAGRYFPLASTNNSVADVAFSPSGLLYGISPSTSTFSADKLYIIDPSIPVFPGSSSVSDLLDTSGNILLQSLRSLAFASDNKLYAVGTSATGTGSFYQIDTNTKVATLVAALPVGFNNSGDLVYDAANNRFLASSADTGTSDALWQIPLANPASATKLGRIGFLNIRGLAVENGQITGYTPATGANSGTDKITINASTGVGTFSQNLPTYGDISGAATIVPLTTPVRNDFNGDRKSDILWRNDFGSVALWQMNGATVTSGSLTSVPNIDPSWKTAGTGDFNGDGKSDILWRNTNGSIAVWTMDGATVTSSSLTSTPALDNNWTTAGTGDYNGDGKADILWRNTNGGVVLWTMDGATVKSSTKTSTPSLDSSWKVAGNSDFNGDGKSDILWRNDDGSVALWQMNGAAITASTAVAKVSTDWKIAGTGDFNGDGKADILWRNDNGTIALWQMDGATLVASSQTSTPSLDSSWNVAGIGDYNGDGKSDLLWRNTGGAAVVWTMNGANVVSSTLTSIAADGNGWKVAAPII